MTGGGAQTLEIREDDHPLLPNVIMFAGAGATVSYEPEAVDELGYDRHQIKATINTLINAYGGK